MHSAVPVSRYSSTVFDARTSLDSFPLTQTPDNVQGYGEVNLLNAIPASADDNKAQNLYIVDAFPFAGRTNYVLQLEVQSSNKPLKVTLAWYDPPSGIGSSSSLLARNLNLYVRHVSSQTKWYGNGASYNKMDTINPQEQIFITSPPPGVYEVYVSSPSTSYSTTAAVVITCHGSVTSEFATYSGQLNEILSPESESTVVAPEVSKAEEIAMLPSLFDPSSISDIPFFGSLSTTVSSPFDVTLDPLNRVCIDSFDITATSDQLHSVKIDLNAALHGGSSAFVLAVLLIAPNGELVQVGGYITFAASDRLWARLWPVQWASASAPPDGSSRYISTRFLLDTELIQTGTWNVCLEMLYEDWQTTHYQGTVTVNFIDSRTVTSVSKTKDAFSSHFNNMTLALSVFAVGLVIAIVVGLGFRQRASAVQKVKRSQSSNKSRPLASSESLEEEVAMAPIRRKTKIPKESESIESMLYSPRDNQNLNPIFDEEAAHLKNEQEGLWAYAPVKKTPEVPLSGGGATTRSMLASMTSAKPKYQPPPSNNRE